MKKIPPGKAIYLWASNINTNHSLSVHINEMFLDYNLMRKYVLIRFSQTNVQPFVFWPILHVQLILR